MVSISKNILLIIYKMIKLKNKKTIDNWYLRPYNVKYTVIILQLTHFLFYQLSFNWVFSD